MRMLCAIAADDIINAALSPRVVVAAHRLAVGAAAVAARRAGASAARFASGGVYAHIAAAVCVACFYSRSFTFNAPNDVFDQAYSISLYV